ncbi:tRNA pseudouridine(13) synthase TruD [Caldichromatium japonicum]|uniref:tRNA pseudouridine(13) synthase TruD n=1 Tax=Caldichromatium japonicum TaxID=2699430 RepID=UPI001FE2FB0B|nr:tRNA pseudouridine(13) synthase TruD [Caldichromatium japonicum]
MSGSLGAGLPCWTAFADLPQAHGAPLGMGLLRVEPQDFRVSEVLGFTPMGEGDHCWLWVRKTGVNTEWVARRLAALSGLPVRDVGYAGLKDRWAVTEQWFSLPRKPGPEPDWGALAGEGIEVLAVHRHRRKLQRGALTGNRFHIRIRGVQIDPQALAERVSAIRVRGVPNYFGEQRFGLDEDNLRRAHALFVGDRRRATPHQRGLWLSAVRAQLFNEVLAERVRRGDWDQPRAGDCLQLDGNRSFFCAEQIDETLFRRVLHCDLHPTGPLWGKGELPTRGAVQALELAVAASLTPWPEGLAVQGLHQERRPLRLMAEGLVGEQVGDCLDLAFSLPRGGYATSLLRELIHWPV